MNFFIRALLGFCFLFPATIFAFEPQCFDDYAQISHNSSSPIFVSTENQNDLFFTQNNSLIPFVLKPQSDPQRLDYTLSSSITNFPVNKVSVLTDDSPASYMEVNPAMGSGGFSITLDFKSRISTGSIVSNFDINSPVPSTIAVSFDNIKYNLIDWGNISKYSFRYLKITFPSLPRDGMSVFLRTLRFHKTQQNIYIVNPPSRAPIQVYRSWNCDSEKFSVLQGESRNIGKDIKTSLVPKDVILVKFSHLTRELKNNKSVANNIEPHKDLPIVIILSVVLLFCVAGSVLYIQKKKL